MYTEMDDSTKSPEQNSKSSSPTLSESIWQLMQSVKPLTPREQQDAKPTCALTSERSKLTFQSSPELNPRDPSARESGSPSKAEKKSDETKISELQKDGKPLFRELLGDAAAVASAYAVSQLLNKYPGKFAPQKGEVTNEYKANNAERPADSTSDDWHVRRQMGDLGALSEKLNEADFTRLYPSLKGTLDGSAISAKMAEGKLTLRCDEGKGKETEITINAKNGEMIAKRKSYSEDRKFCIEEKLEAGPAAARMAQSLKAIDAYKCLVRGDKQGYYESINGIFDTAHKAKGVEGLKEAIAITQDMWSSMGVKMKEATFKNSRGEEIPGIKRNYEEISGFALKGIRADGLGGNIEINYASDYTKPARKYDFNPLELFPKK